MRFLPGIVILDQVSEQVLGEFHVALRQVHRPDRIGQPGAVTARLRARRAEPVAGIILGIAPVAQPAHFIDLMARRTTDGPISARPEWPIDKFGERIAALG